MIAGNTQSTQAWREAAWLLLLAGAYRALFLFLVPPLVDSADALMYLDGAERIGAGSLNELSARVPILYPLLAGTLHATGLDAEAACRIVSFLFGSAVVIPVYFLGLRLFGLRAARVSAVVVAIWPWLADWSGRIAPESTALFLWFSAIYVLWRAVDGRWWAAWAAPCLFFALHLARPEGTLLMLFAPFAAAIMLYRRPRHFWMRLVPYLVSCTILLAAHATLSVVLGGTGSVNARIDPAGSLQYVFIERTAELAQAFSQILFENIAVMLGPVLLCLIGVGLLGVGMRARDTRAEWYVLAFAAAQTGLAILSTYAEPRYTMTTVVALTLWAGRGVDITVEGCLLRGQPRRARIPVAVVVGSLFLGLVITAAPEYTGRAPREPREYRIAGEWMQEHCEPGLIVVRKPQVGYYAGMPTTGPLPEFTLERTVEWMRAIDARYLVVDERYGVTLAPALRPLLDPDKAPPALRLLADDVSPFPGAKVVIYELVAP